MAAITCLDTHVVVALATGNGQVLSRPARRALENDVLRLSPMVSVELAFLYEIGRLRPAPTEFLNSVLEDLGITWCQSSFLAASEAAQGLGWTRDPFDRIITAHAQAEGARLVTKDETIRQHFKKAIW